MDLTVFPTINASLNALAGGFLIAGWFAIHKKKDQILHRKLMTGALVSSSLFLVCYLYYHYHVGTTHYQGKGILRVIYLIILGTHTPLAALIVPFAIAAVIFAVQGNFTKHTAITTKLWPVWLYVSITGVIIYLMLYVFKPV